MSKPALSRVYIQNPNLPTMEKVFLSDDIYAKAMQAFVIVCTDAVIVNRTHRTIYLARRTVEPMKGLWWIGGRRFAGEDQLTSMVRCFQRETGLALPGSRFTFVDRAEYIWATREQEPQDAGSHNLADTFAVELGASELAQARLSLEQREYDRNFGLQAFQHQDLAQAGVHPVILDIYDKIFG